MTGMITIAGLGNPGEEYKNTRHNIGREMASAFVGASGLPDFVSSSTYSGEISEGMLHGKDVRVLLPDTYMNKSGASVKKAVTKDAVEDLVVVYDELDLPIGEMKVSFGRGSGGHNGVESIINALQSKDFVRVRIGISPVSFFGKMHRPKGERVSPFVLQTFSRREAAKLERIEKDVLSALTMLIQEGKEHVMNTYN